MIILSGQSLPALSNPGAAGDLKNGKQLIDANGNVLTGTMPNITLPSPGITVSTGGLITASYSQDAGYSAGGSKSATKQLTTQAGTTITPGRSQKTAVASGRYTTGAVYVAGDSDLVASNIKSGVNIFGVTGNYGSNLYDIRICGYRNKSYSPNRTSGSTYYYRLEYSYDGNNQVTLSFDPSASDVLMAGYMMLISGYNDKTFMRGTYGFSGGSIVSGIGTSVIWSGFDITDITSSYTEFKIDSSIIEDELGCYDGAFYLNAGSFIQFSLNDKPIWPES